MMTPLGARRSTERISSGSRAGSSPRLVTEVHMSAPCASSSAARTIAAKNGSSRSGTARLIIGEHPERKALAIGLGT